MFDMPARCSPLEGADGGPPGAVALSSSDPIVASDPTFRIVAWNEGAEALLGYSRAEVLGAPCYELIGCPDTAGRLLCHSERAECRDCGRPRVVPTFQREVRKKSGERICADVTTLVTATRAGQSVVVHLLRDVTRQKQVERLLRAVVCGASKLCLPPAPEGDVAEPAASAVSPREREVIRLLARGASTDAIAAQLSITPRTTRNHIQNILEKLGVHSRLEAVVYASTNGLL